MLRTLRPVRRLASHTLRASSGRNLVFAKALVAHDVELESALRQGIVVHQHDNKAATIAPPPHLPLLPPVVQDQLDEWAKESEAQVEGAQRGMKAYSCSVPLLLASQLGRAEETAVLGGRMISHLDAEVAAGDMSPAFRAWMLGRLLLASDQSSDLASATIFEKYLREVLDDIVVQRALRSRESMEIVTDPMEAWAWGYLLMHYGGEQQYEAAHWLKATRMVWSAIERAATQAATREQHGNRMWVNTLSMLAFSSQHASGTVRASPDPLAKSSMTEMYEDAQLLFRYAHDPAAIAEDGEVDLGIVPSHQLSLADALRQIPSSDFRAWAVGLARLAGVQAAVEQLEGSELGLQKGELDDVFIEAMQQSSQPGDRALGTTNWIYAKYVEMWRRSVQ